MKKIGYGLVYAEMGLIYLQIINFAIMIYEALNTLR